MCINLYGQSPGFNIKNVYPTRSTIVKELNHIQIDSLVISKILSKNQIYSADIIEYNNQRQQLKNLNIDLKELLNSLIVNSYLLEGDKKKLTEEEVSKKLEIITSHEEKIKDLQKDQESLFVSIREHIHNSDWLNDSKYKKDYDSIQKIFTNPDNLDTQKYNTNKLVKAFKKNYAINANKYLISNNIIEHNYLQAEQNTLIKKISDLENRLYSNSLISETKFDKDERIRIKNSIKNSKKEVAQNKIILDSLYLEYTKDYLKHKSFSFFSFGPKRSRAFFDMVYDNSGKQFKLINESGFSISNKSGSIYSELVSGNLGIVRVSLGTTISRSSNDSITIERQEEAFQRLISNGGNTTLKVEYPIAYLHFNNNQYNLISRILAKGTADFPEFGTSTDEWAGSGSIGLDIYADASLDNNQLRFFASFNINGVFGTTTFRNNLGIDNSNFSFGQLTLGLVIAENLKLSFVLSTISSERSLRNRNGVLGGQVLH
jgi:hypothetical protein